MWLSFAFADNAQSLWLSPPYFKSAAVGQASPDPSRASKETKQGTSPRSATTKDASP